MLQTTPGVYFELVDRGRPAIGTLRTDIAGFMGYTERGPLGPIGEEQPFVAVRLTSWRQFQAVFGEPLANAYLGEAVRAYFDNGGAACHVVRVADTASARAASVRLESPAASPDRQTVLTLTAGHGVLADSNTGQPRVEDGRPVRYLSPGAWGNRLAVEVVDATAGFAQVKAQADDAQLTFVDSLTGFRVGSVVRFVQVEAEITGYRQVTAITPHLKQIRWDQPLTGLGLDFARPFRLETREFGLRVLLDGQIVEQHDALSIAREHPGYVVDVIQTASVYLEAELTVGSGGVTDPEAWPAATAPRSLTGGRDGLATVGRAHFLGALEALGLVDEVSVLAAPDLVLEAEAPEAQPPLLRQVCCENLDPPPTGVIRGLVVTTDDGTIQPIGNVVVTPISAPGASEQTGSDGTFTLTGLPEGQVTLRLERAGFFVLESAVQARAGASDPAVLSLRAVPLPRPLSGDDVADVQAAMARQGELGLYRVALLDAPASMLKLDDIQTWRTRFDTAFAALYYPWLVVRGADGPRLVPPSGHVAGLIARTDLQQGVHRAPANFELRGVEALSHPVNDVEHGILNAQGINAIRTLPGRGIRVHGARTLSSAAEWRFLNVRRLVLMIEEAIEEANQWAVFEPNNPLLRQILGHGLRQFLDALWRQGALAGSTPQAAYQVKCDVENNPPSVVDAGQLVAEVAIAPSVPFEFIRFRLGRTVGALTVTE